MFMNDWKQTAQRLKLQERLQTINKLIIEMDGWKLIALFDIQILSSDIQIMSKSITADS